MPGPSEICGIVLSLLVEVKEQDYNNTWNHLLLSKPTPVIHCGGEDGKTKLAVTGEVHISWSQVPEPLPFKEGEHFRARVTAECNAGRGVDEAASDRFNRWVSYRVWICTASKVEVLDEPL